MLLFCCSSTDIFPIDRHQNQYNQNLSPLDTSSTYTFFFSKKMPPPPVSAFLSVKPLEPVLIFRSAEDAARFQTDYCRQGRIYNHTSPKLVYVPMPEGLLRVRTTRNGDIAFDFETESQAKRFSDTIRYGRLYDNARKTMYIGDKYN